MADRPNIIFIQTDQQRFDALGCVTPLVQTPNLDRLAARGVRFSQAICNDPQCVPSRYSMMLGLLPSQVGVRNNGQSIGDDASLPGPTLPQQMLEAGYQTAAFGKTHWYGTNFDNNPTLRGFETYYKPRSIDPNILPEPGITMEEDDPDDWAAYREEVKAWGVGGESVGGYLGCTSSLSAEKHREGWITRKATDWLDEGRDRARPLFMYFSLDFPHAGLNIPPGYEDRYSLDDIPDRPMPPWTQPPQPGEEHRPFHIEGFYEQWSKLSSEQRRRTTLRYYAATSYIDDMIGDLTAKLEVNGELDDALILFTSDHGEMLGDRMHRFSKYCLYDASVRVPLIVSGSRVPESLRGSVDDRHADLTDIVPTMRDVAGLPVRYELPGRTLLGAPHRCGGFSEMHGAGGRFEPSQRGPMYMWRTRQWKLILWLPGSQGDALLRLDEVRGELYDLVNDPHEWQNRFDDEACAAIRHELTTQLLFYVATCWGRWPRHLSRLGIEKHEPEERGEASRFDGVRLWY